MRSKKLKNLRLLDDFRIYNISYDHDSSKERLLQPFQIHLELLPKL